MSERVVSAVIELSAALRSIGVGGFVIDLDTAEDGAKIEAAFPDLAETYYRGVRHNVSVAGVPMRWPYDMERIPF